MPWVRQTRGPTRGYFYRSLRVNGRPTKVYHGRGPEGELAAALVDRRRQERLAARTARQRQEADLARATAAAQAAQTLAALLGAAVLIVQGCYCHHGEWRRRAR